VKLDKLCIISDQKSERYPILQSELETLTRFVSFNQVRYCYRSAAITDYDYYKYWAWPDDRMSKINWAPESDNNLMLSEKILSLALNHLFSLKIMSNGDENMWSMVCEDDIQIIDKDNFEKQFNQLWNYIPEDADIIWPSSGKQHPDCSFMDVTGFDPPHQIEIKNNFAQVARSRYTDCIMIKNKTAKFLLDKFLEHKITTPIDWEYNYIFVLYPELKSYWLSPAIIKQNLNFKSTLD
jgi:hypothetical protein